MPKASHGMHGSRARGVCRVQHARLDARHVRPVHHARHARMQAFATKSSKKQQQARSICKHEDVIALDAPCRGVSRGGSRGDSRGGPCGPCGGFVDTACKLVGMLHCVAPTQPVPHSIQTHRFHEIWVGTVGQLVDTFVNIPCCCCTGASTFDTLVRAATVSVYTPCCTSVLFVHAPRKSYVRHAARSVVTKFQKMAFLA